MKFSLFLLSIGTVVIIVSAEYECTQDACDKECLDKGHGSGICAVTVDGDLCQCSTKLKECTQEACNTECRGKGREHGVCAVTANGDVCQCSSSSIIQRYGK